MLDQWINHFANPKVNSLKKVMFEVLKERYAQNEPIIDRIGHAMITQEDMDRFLKLVTDVYETAYLKSVADHRKQLEKLGLQVTVVADNSQTSNDG